jgi:hypothetical protein
MDLFNKITKRNPNTLLGIIIEKNKENISILSFMVYFLPIIICFFISYSDIQQSENISPIYSILVLWYFSSVFIINKIEINIEILKLLVCFPVYLSFFISLMIFRIFTNKKIHPDITEDKLYLHQRSIKLKKVKRKIKLKRIRIFKNFL